MMETNVSLQESQLELIVSEKELGHLTTNALQIRDLVKTALPRYDIAHYNDDNIDQAKKDKAMLNKAAKALNAKRIELEREFMRPFTEFKDIVSDTVKLIGDCSARIDAVVKQNEQQYKDKKLADIKEYFQANNPLQVDFGRLFKAEWLNKSTSMKSVRADIDSHMESIKSDLDTLQGLSPDDADVLYAYYMETFDLNATLQYANPLKEQREKNRQDEEEQRQAMKEHPLYTRTFRIRATKEQIIALSDYMNDNHIEFKRIEP